MLAGAALLAAAAGGGGCSPEYYRESADAEVYAIIGEKDKTVFGEERTRPFSLEQYGGRPAPTGEVIDLDLRRALQLAAKHSRSFQDQRESLYLAALTLTGDRYAYAPQFLATLRGALSGDTEESQGSATGTVGVDKAWIWGLQSAIRFSTNVLRTFTSDPMRVATSALTASITQPLLRGFGPDIAGENLTQSERNVIYAVRTFERFRREFAFETTVTYLRTLQRYDAVENARQNLKSTQLNYEKIAAQAQWGQVPFFQVDQAETSVLSSQENVNRAENDLKNGLDALKVVLGLPVEQEIRLDPEELKTLSAIGSQELKLSIDEATEIALACRLDLANQREQVEDAERTVVIAADRLRTRLDLTGQLTIPSEDNVPGKLLTEKLTYTVGAELDLPLERTLERNSYRSSLITLERRKRSFEEVIDRTRLAVATAVRTLDRALTSYQISVESAQLARQRVESTEALMEWGRVQTRDVLDSLITELQAKNAVTTALVDYESAYLGFLLALEVLEVDEDGVYVDLALENADAKEETDRKT